METAAAILTQLAFEHNDQLRSALNAFDMDTARGVQNVILPLYQDILASLRERATSGGPAANANPANPSR